MNLDGKCDNCGSTDVDVMTRSHICGAPLVSQETLKERIAAAREPGKWCLIEDRLIYATLPSGEMVSLPVRVSKERGGRDADGYSWWAWDGDRERPSLRASILGRKTSWHGYLDKGVFVDKVKDEKGDWW